MKYPVSNIQIAEELAARLASTFNVRPHLFRSNAQSWEWVSQLAKQQQPFDSIATIEALVVRASQQLDALSQPVHVSTEDGRMKFFFHLSSERKNRLALYFELENHNVTLVQSWVNANLEALWHREEANTSRKEIELYIDQVTQDFEELSWLRSANEYLDLCSAKHSLDSLASCCLTDLTEVIRAQSILFVPVNTDAISGQEIGDSNRIMAAGSSDAKIAICLRFLNDSVGNLSGNPYVVNAPSNHNHIPGYSGIRNCILVPVAKGAKTYGWLMAVNKTSKHTQDGDASDRCAPVSFGTFEAGLVAAASNILSAQARNLEFFESQENLLTGVVRAIINAIDAKDPYTCGHSDRVASYAKRIAVRLGLSDEECEKVYMAGVLHDVGKIGVPDSILGKPGKLTDDEYAIVKKHPEIGYAILKHLKQLDYVLPGVLHHHEAVNGSGYPHGLAGEAIPLHGRILAVADAYDAMTSNRPYRSGMPSEKAEAILKAEAGKTWDSDIIAVFLECLANNEIQPHSTSPNIAFNLLPGFDPLDIDSNRSLMGRIANSFNNMVVG